MFDRHINIIKKTLLCSIQVCNTILNLCALLRQEASCYFCARFVLAAFRVPVILSRSQGDEENPQAVDVTLLRVRPADVRENQVRPSHSPCIFPSGYSLSDYPQLDVIQQLPLLPHSKEVQALRSSGLPFSKTSGAIKGLVPALLRMTFRVRDPKLQARLKSASFHVRPESSTLSSRATWWLSRKAHETNSAK